MTMDRPSPDTLRAWLRDSEIDARPGPSCPSAERLWSAANGEADPQQTRSIVAHTSQCGACSEAWRIAADLAEASGAGSRRPLPRRASLGPWLVLAASVVGVGLLVVLTPGPEPPPSPAEYRDVENDVAIRSALPDGAALPRGDFVLRWSAVPTAAAYDVEVAAEDLTPLRAFRGLGATECRVPPDALATVPEGGRVVWRVSARLPGGLTIRSGAFVVRVAGDRER